MSFSRHLNYKFCLLLSIFYFNTPVFASTKQNDKQPSTNETSLNIQIDAKDIPDLLDHPANSTTLNTTNLKDTVNTSPDTAELFKNQMGVSLYKAGPISSLPVINGMADERIATIIDGMRITADCPNHMNPALSYLNPHDISIAQVIAGITPVSLGGDSLGGTINIERKAPIFATKKDKILTKGEISSFYHSNGTGIGTSGNITVANDHFSIRYNGSWSQAHNYHAGAGGGTVHSTSYRNFSHDVTLGYKKDNHLFTLNYAQTDTPYEGFPNQYMDMTNNRSISINGNYKGDFDWGTFEARGYWQKVTHVMNMLKDKGGHSATTGMPMNSNEQLVGYNLKATLFLDEKHTLKIGNSFDHSAINDWWPPVQGGMSSGHHGMMMGKMMSMGSMMGPNTYHNINDGHRDRLGTFAEWQAQWKPEFMTLLGIRNDIIMMNTGKVSGYKGLIGSSNAEHTAITNFNNANRGRTDVNFDVTALARWTVNQYFTWEGGYARKTRSPNMYERYSWGVTPMAMRMIGWFGDGNGYLGNINLKPEVGNTISTTLNFHDSKQEKWEIKIQPFYSYIHHYINVNYLGSTSTHGINVSKLQFANHNAQTYGINSTESYRLWNSEKYGKAILKGNINWVMGQDRTTHNNLYHMMPLNGNLSFNEIIGPWTGRIEASFVNTKSLVDSLRREPRTPGYILFNLGGSYTWRMFRIDASIENIANKKYYLPLGGLSLGDLIATNNLRALPGMGRSFNIAVTASF